MMEIEFFSINLKPDPSHLPSRIETICDDSYKAVEDISRRFRSLTTTMMMCQSIWYVCGLIAVSQAAWVRVWEDNFDWNGGVDLNKWEFDVGGSGWG